MKTTRNYWKLIWKFLLRKRFQFHSCRFHWKLKPNKDLLFIRPLTQQKPSISNIPQISKPSTPQKKFPPDNPQNQNTFLSVYFCLMSMSILSFSNINFFVLFLTINYSRSFMFLQKNYDQQLKLLLPFIKFLSDKDFESILLSEVWVFWICCAVRTFRFWCFFYFAKYLWDDSVRNFGCLEEVFDLDLNWLLWKWRFRWSVFWLINLINENWNRMARSTVIGIKIPENLLA